MKPPTSPSKRSREKASRFALLGMLSLGGARSGYDLKKAIASTTANFWSESYGNIYPALRSLAEDKLIRPQSQKRADTERRKQLYSITALGKRALEAWLREQPAVRTEDNELLLKLFFGSMMPPRAARELVSANREHHQGLLKRFEVIEHTIAQGSLSDEQKTYLRITVDYGRTVSQALVAWADTTMEALGKLDR